MKTVRAFLAIPLPAALQQRIAVLQAELSQALRGIHWTRAETVHLTLHFFGATNTDDLEKIRSSMLSVTLRERAFQVNVRGLGAFPDRRRPRVIWLGLAPQEPLRDLWRSCEAELAGTGIPAEPRAFVPHLTIGRCREGGPDATALLVEQANRDIGRLPVEQLILFESQLLPGGARHIPLLTVPLQRNDPLTDRITREGTDND